MGSPGVSPSRRSSRLAALAAAGAMAGGGGGVSSVGVTGNPHTPSVGAPPGLNSPFSLPGHPAMISGRRQAAGAGYSSGVAQRSHRGDRMREQQAQYRSQHFTGGHSPGGGACGGSPGGSALPAARYQHQNLPDPADPPSPPAHDQTTVDGKLGGSYWPFNGSGNVMVALLFNCPGMG
jgi:hypothetical protein